MHKQFEDYNKLSYDKLCFLLDIHNAQNVYYLSITSRFAPKSFRPTCHFAPSRFAPGRFAPSRFAPKSFRSP